MLRGPFLKPDLSGLRKESHRHRLPFDRRGFFEPFVFATAALPLQSLKRFELEIDEGGLHY